MNPGDTLHRERPERDGAAAADPREDEIGDAVRAVRGGDTAAFGRVVERYQRRLFALLLILTREPSAAEELAQDAFVRAFTHLDAYDERRPFYPWLATIAVRLAQNWLTRRGRLAAREGPTPAPDIDNGMAADPLDALIADEHGRRLWRMVAVLPSGERAAVLLYYRQEMSVRDIAHALGVTSGTVKTLLFRARVHLRRTAAQAQLDKEEK